MTLLAVQVAVNSRPLVRQEIEEGCSHAFSVTGNSVNVKGSEQRFTFDHVFDGVDRRDVFTRAVQPLLEGCTEGLNTTILAYGQTGSGKTFTMGTSGESSEGILGHVVHDVFGRVDGDFERYSIKVSFLEIYREELSDLLSEDKISLVVREDSEKNVFVAGLKELPVNSPEQLLSILKCGCKKRVTGATDMNATSSRSHAVFSIIIDNNDKEAGVLKTSRIHLVDLAGSERAKRTKAEGERLLEGIDINKGLLVLGNVISALGGNRPLAHIPYRDSKLTRILQDSLGGNSRTLMIACMSPADVNFEETLNTLKYANRARNIKNKPVVNNSYEGSKQLISEMKSKIDKLEMEIIQLKSGENRPIRGTTASSNKIILDLSSRNLQLEQHIFQLKEQYPDLEEKSMESIPVEEEELDDEHTARQIELQLQLQKTSVVLESTCSNIQKMTQSKAAYESMRVSFEEAIQKIVTELDTLQLERDDLVAKLESTSDDQQNTKRQDLLTRKLQDLEDKNALLRKKQNEQAKLLSIQSKHNKSLEHIQQHVLELKQTKVGLMKRMKQESEDHRRWKNQKDKEVKQMQKKERMNEYLYSTLQRKHEKQEMVLRRKSEEAAVAQQKLKSLLNRQRASQKVKKPTNIAQTVKTQLEIRVSIERAKLALESEIEKRKELMHDNQQQSQCTIRITELQQNMYEAQEMLEHFPVKTAVEAKSTIDAMLKLSITAKCGLQDSNSKVKELEEELTEMTQMFTEKEHAMHLDFSNTLREYEEKIMFVMQNQYGDSFQLFEDRIAALGAENERLINLLANQCISSKKKNKAKSKPAVHVDISDISDDDWGEADEEEDEEWIEPAPNTKKSRKSKESAKPHFDEHTDKLSADILERVEQFKVKELQDALHLFGESVSGRKSDLKMRLLGCLVAKNNSSDKSELLPKDIPSRHNSDVGGETAFDVLKVEGENNEDQNLKQQRPLHLKKPRIALMENTNLQSKTKDELSQITAKRKASKQDEAMPQRKIVLSNAVQSTIDKENFMAHRLEQWKTKSEKNHPLVKGRRILGLSNPN